MPKGRRAAPARAAGPAPRTRRRCARARRRRRVEERAGATGRAAPARALHRRVGHWRRGSLGGERGGRRHGARGPAGARRAAPAPPRARLRRRDEGAAASARGFPRPPGGARIIARRRSASSGETWSTSWSFCSIERGVEPSAVAIASSSRSFTGMRLPGGSACSLCSVSRYGVMPGSSWCGAAGRRCRRCSCCWRAAASSCDACSA